MRPTIQFSCRVTVLVLALLWLCQTPIWAGIYKWKDDQGKVHFTDDKSRIPLKYRGHLEKFRGVTEPKPEPVEEPVDAEKGQETVAPEPVVAEDKGTGEEKGPGEETGEKKKNLKLVATLKETIKYLEDNNRGHQRMIKFVKPDVQNGRYYILSIRKGVGQKKQMIEKLDDFKQPSLKSARRFLKSSLFQDKSEKIGGDDYLERVQRLKQRLEKEIRSKNKIIKKLQADLDEAGE